MFKKFIPILIIIVLGVLDFALIGFAWQNPTQAPPSGNLTLPWTKSGTNVYLTNSSDKVGIGTTNPNSSAILDLTSTSTGFLLPRMTSDQRNAINSPATGLLVFNTTDTKINVWDGIEWGEVGGAGWALNGNNLYNTNTGNVGIGTTTPSSLLTIDSTSQSISPLRIEISPFSSSLGYNYRKPITITNNSGETLTDFQVLISFNTATLISAGKMQSSCNDIRVADSDGSTFLSYWIYPGTCNTSATRIYVKVPSISTQTKIIYIYYGNFLASSASNGNNTFIQFGDFSGTSLPPNWTSINIGTTGSASVSAGKLIVSNINGADVWQSTYQATLAYYNAPVSGNFIAEARITSFTSTNPNTYGKAGLLVQNNQAARKSNGVADMFITYSAGFEFAYQSSATYVAPDLSTRSGSTAYPGYLKLIKSGTSVSGYYSLNGITWNQQGSAVTPNGISTSQYISLFVTPHNTGTGEAQFDVFFVRKYNSSEPTIAIGSEEQMAQNVTTALFISSSGKVGIGTASTSNYALYVNGPAFSTGGWQLSDIRLKENITPLVNVSEKLDNLTGVSFNWKSSQFPEKNLPTGTQLGLIAQEVEKQFPELINYDNEGYKSVSYNGFSAILLQAFKELKARIDNIEKIIGNGFGQFQELTSKKITVDVATLKNLELIDQVTGETYCVGIRNGKWFMELGKCKIY